MPIYQSFPGIRAFSGILFALLSGEAAPGRISGWSGKVHQADFGAFERVPQEKAAGADEAQHVVRGHEAVGARGVFPAQQTQLAQAVLHGHSGGLGRIHDAHVIAYHMAQGFAEQGEVRAAQHQGVGPVGPSRGEQVAQIAAGDALDDGAVHPAFLGQGHEKGAGPALDAGLGAQGGDGLLVGAAGDGGFGGDDHDDAALVLQLGDGGAALNWSFIQAGMCDEVSVVIAAVADGSANTQTLFMTREGMSDDTPVAFKLQEAKVMDGDSIWLRYLVKNVKEN